LIVAVSSPSDKENIMKSFLRARILQILLLPLLAFSCRDGGMHTGGKHIVLPAGEVHQGWYFAGGDNVYIDGTINGDAFIAGGIVEINGTINGELFVAGGQVSVNGKVTDRVIAAGGNVRLAGRTDKSIIAAGGSVILTRVGSAGENLLGAGGNVMVDGTVGGNARLAGGHVDIGGEVKGNLDDASEYFRTENGAVVRGDLTVATKDSANVEIAQGTTRGTYTLKIHKEEAESRILGFRPWRIICKLLFMLSLFVCALVLSFMFPKQILSIGTTMMERPGESVLAGIATLIFAPIAAVVLFITVIGVPLGILLLGYYFWLMYLSQLTLGVALGFRLMSSDGKQGWALFGTVAVGMLIVDAVTFIPFVNVIVILAGLVLGVGALAIVTREQYLSLRNA
jgi:hypothetical protein